jgi:hypothetical protein
MYSIPGTWQVPAKEVVRVLGIFRGNIGTSFVHYPTLCLWRRTYEDILLLRQMFSEGLVSGGSFDHDQRSATNPTPRVAS